MTNHHAGTLSRRAGIRHGAGISYAAVFAALLLAPVIAAWAAEPPTIVVIGGQKPGRSSAEHNYPDVVQKLDRLVRSSPDLAALKPRTKIFPAGFPADLKEIEDADLLIFYFGTRRNGAGSINPVQDPAARDALAKLQSRGVGLIALHQSFTKPANGDLALLDNWIGGTRVALMDYSIEMAPISVAAPEHPVSRGLTGFALLDEFYPTVAFGADAGVTPILNARVHVQHRGTNAVFEEPSVIRPLAWARESRSGSRGFTFAAGHYLSTFDNPQVRKMLLNAVLWTLKSDVPAAGARDTEVLNPEAAGTNRVVLASGEVALLPQDWGTLKWFASREIGNTTTMTVGLATIRPGQANPAHWHPNTDEILHVVQGHIMHRVGDREYEMRAGDTVVIPEGTVHNARNIGSEDALLMVSFNSADRVAIGE